jgi:hypothetical protein
MKFIMANQVYVSNDNLLKILQSLKGKLEALQTEINTIMETIEEGGDYQEQTTTAMTGKLLTGGATPGTFGPPVNVTISQTDLVDGSSPLPSGDLYFVY